MEETSPTNPANASLMVPVHMPILENHPLGTNYSFTKQTVIVFRIVDPKFVKIVFTGFSYMRHKVPPSFYMHVVFSLFVCLFHFYRTLFMGLQEPL